MPINSRSILVVGGAGYIGSHMARMLQLAGFLPVILDNFSTGHQDSVADLPLFVGNMSDKSLLQSIFDRHHIAAVMHFASYIEVGESMRSPAKYYENNVAATLHMLDVMLKNNVRHFIFSSTAAVYGEPHSVPIEEQHALFPLNPYGKSKAMVETILQDYGIAENLQYAILRYFNAAGVDPSGTLGERHKPETHLIPLVLEVAAGKRSHITVYGNDYPTPDGTCVRDYVHVNDICEAHLLALKKLLSGQSNIICNLGSGLGYSVLEVIEAARNVTKHPIPIHYGERRDGDPAILVASSEHAQTLLGWQPRYSELHTLLTDAWKYETIQQRKLQTTE